MMPVSDEVKETIFKVKRIINVYCLRTNGQSKRAKSIKPNHDGGGGDDMPGFFYGRYKKN